MFLPYATDQPTEKTPWMTLALSFLQGFIAILLLVGTRFWGWDVNTILHRYGLVPANLHLLNLFTYSFLHIGLAHLLLNLFFLWVFGGGVESAVGSGGVLAIFLVSGALGGWLQRMVVSTLLPPDAAYVPIIGASAACSGLIGVYAVRYYRARLAFAFLPIRPHVVAVVFLFLAGEIGSGLWRLWQGDTAYGVAHWAHIGGFVTGLTAAFLLRLPQKAHRAYFTRDAHQAVQGNRPGAAIPRWEAMLQQNPNDPHIHAELGRAWELFGDKEQAVLHFHTALTLYLQAKQRESAAQLYIEMQSLQIPPCPLPASAQYQLGCALEESEHLPYALQAFSEVYQNTPQSSEAELALLKAAALCARTLRRREEALQLLNQFQQSYPHSQWLYLAEGLARELNTPPKKSGY